MQKLLSFVEMNNPLLCFNLRLHAAVAANRCAKASANEGSKNEFSPITYEFMTEAFLTYESEITDSTHQKNAMTRVIGTLLFCDYLETSDYEGLIKKTTQYAARLLKKTDQCSMVLMCSHLFFKDEVRFIQLLNYVPKDFQSKFLFSSILSECLSKAPTCSRMSSKSFEVGRYVYISESIKLAAFRGHF